MKEAGVMCRRLAGLLIAVPWLLGGCFLVHVEEQSANEYAWEAKEALAAANRHFEAGEYESAIPLYRKVLWIRPALSLEAYRRLASIYESTGKMEEACAVCKKGLAHLKGDANYYTKYAVLCKQLGRLEDALYAWRLRRELSPSDEEARREIEELELPIAEYVKGGKGRRSFWIRQTWSISAPLRRWGCWME